jgi:hypothetical protein
VVKVGFQEYGCLERFHLIGRQDFPHRVFPEGEDIVPMKGKCFMVFFPQKPPSAVLLNRVRSGYKAVPGKSVLPVINPQDGLEIRQGDKAV